MTPPATKTHNHHNQRPSSSKPPNATTTTTTPAFENPITLSQQDLILSRSTHLTRHELLKRRSHNLKQLCRCYRDHYWALMEELKTQFKDYYWKFGVSPFKEDHQQQQSDRHGDDVNCGGDLGLNKSSNRRCSSNACKLKAMALTNYCHLHILSDPNQKLYKPCDYVIKSYPTAPIVCGKPILRSTIPSLCTVHLQKSQKHVNRALRQSGLNVSMSNKFSSKFHVIVAEYVRVIQAKRRAARRIKDVAELDGQS